MLFAEFVLLLLLRKNAEEARRDTTMLSSTQSVNSRYMLRCRCAAAQAVSIFILRIERRENRRRLLLVDRDDEK